MWEFCLRAVKVPKLFSIPKCTIFPIIYIFFFHLGTIRVTGWFSCSQHEIIDNIMKLLSYDMERNSDKNNNNNNNNNNSK